MYEDVTGEVAATRLSRRRRSQVTHKMGNISFNTPDAYYKFHCERTLHPIDPARCSKTVTKARKLLIKLHKVSFLENWAKLRAAA